MTAFFVKIDKLCALRVNCKWSDLICCAIFQGLGQLVVHNVTIPLFRVHFRGLGHETTSGPACGGQWLKSVFLFLYHSDDISVALRGSNYILFDTCTLGLK